MQVSTWMLKVRVGPTIGVFKLVLFMEILWTKLYWFYKHFFYKLFIIVIIERHGFFYLMRRNKGFKISRILGKNLIINEVYYYISLFLF